MTRKIDEDVNSKYLKYSDTNLKNMKSIQIFKTNEKEINSMDFSRDGNLLITSSKDDSICLYSIPKRELSKKLYNKTYGVENVIFTHISQAVLCTSNKDFRIMYWNLHSNEVIFSFLGHADLITDLNMSPKDDLFISTSRDKSSRLWDLNAKKCLAIFQESNFACYDNTGSVIASISSQLINTNQYSNHLNLYSEKDYKNGPFNVFKVNADGSVIKQLKFSYDGTMIFCNTEDNLIIVVDSYEGNVIKKLTAEISSSDMLIKFDISPDSKYCISGSESGNIIIWNVESQQVIGNVSCHPLTSNCVKFNPVYNVIASSCQNTVLWQPMED